MSRCRAKRHVVGSWFDETVLASELVAKTDSRMVLAQLVLQRRPLFNDARNARNECACCVEHRTVVTVFGELTSEVVIGKVADAIRRWRKLVHGVRRSSCRAYYK